MSFSLPYFLSYFSQTLYGMADLFIIGQFEGVASTTAVSVGSQVMHMLTVMIVGLAMGSTVSIGQAVGARDMKRAARSIGNTATLFLGLSLVLTVLLLLLVRPIVSVMSTPEAAVAGTVDYQKLMSYIRGHGLEVGGFSREITMIDYGITNDTEKFVTEISIPVLPRA